MIFVIIVDTHNLHTFKHNILMNELLLMQFYLFNTCPKLCHRKWRKSRLTSWRCSVKKTKFWSVSRRHRQRKWPVAKVTPGVCDSHGTPLWASAALNWLFSEPPTIFLDFYRKTWCQNYVTSSTEYLIFTSAEYVISPKHVQTMLCKSEHFSRRYKRKREWEVSLNTVYYTTY